MTQIGLATLYFFIYDPGFQRLARVSGSFWLVTSNDRGQCKVRTLLNSDTGKMFLTWCFAYKVIQHACTENTPWRVQKILHVLVWNWCVICLTYKTFAVCVDLFNRSVIRSTCTKQCMKEWNNNTASLQVFVSGLEVGIFRHLTIQFPFRVTTRFQNDSRCISIFSNSAVANL